MRTTALFIFFSLPVLLFSCNKEEGCTDPDAVNYNSDAEEDDGSCEFLYRMGLRFSHEVEGEDLEFNQQKYTNKMGNPYSVNRLRYMISDIVLHRKGGGKDISIDDHHFVRLEPNTSIQYQNNQDNPTLAFNPGREIEGGDFEKVSFIFGMDAEKNISGEYPELNQASWSWPESLGGGYHFLQLEGKYDSAGTGTKPYNLHLGTAREVSGNDTTYVDNHFQVTLKKDFTIRGQTTLELTMNLNKWFEKPPSELDEGNGKDWDMEEWPKAVMPSYSAQRTLHDNGKDVFSFSVN